MPICRYVCDFISRIDFKIDQPEWSTLWHVRKIGAKILENLKCFFVLYKLPLFFSKNCANYEILTRFWENAWSRPQNDVEIVDAENKDLDPFINIMLYWHRDQRPKWKETILLTVITVHVFSQRQPYFSPFKGIAESSLICTYEFLRKIFSSETR